MGGNRRCDEQGETLDPSGFAAHFERIRQWKESQVRAIQEKKEPHQRSEDGFLARLAKKVRDSLQIRIRNFRIRYADRRSTTDEVRAVRDDMGSLTVRLRLPVTGVLCLLSRPEESRRIVRGGGGAGEPGGRGHAALEGG